MKEWEVRKLGEVVEASGTIDPTKAPNEPFRYVDVSSVSNETFEILETQQLLGKDAPSRARRLIRSGDVLFATIRPTLKRIAIVPPELDGEVCSTGYFVFRTKPLLDGRFLFYHLLSDDFLAAMESLQTGASYPAVNDAQVKAQSIRFPPLDEQRRIVAVLDEAFAGLATMRANAEANLKNARALFDSHLNAIFSQSGEGWVEDTIGNCFKLSSGQNLTSKSMVDGQFPVFGGNGIAGMHNEFNLSGDNVVIGRVGALCGNVRNVTDRIWLTDNAFRVVDPRYKFDNRFLTYLLNFKNLRSLARQSAQPVISNSSLKDVVLTFPESAKAQNDVGVQLDTLLSETTRLESLYRQKLAAIDELKQSILHRAFSGQLTGEAIAA